MTWCARYRISWQREIVNCSSKSFITYVSDEKGTSKEESKASKPEESKEDKEANKVAEKLEGLSVRDGQKVEDKASGDVGKAEEGAQADR